MRRPYLKSTNRNAATAAAMKTKLSAMKKVSNFITAT